MGMYRIIEAHDWPRLKSMVLSGYREDMSDYDYKDYPLIFDVIHAEDPGSSDMACFWLDHGYPHYVTGGRMNRTIAHAAAAAGLPDVLRKLGSLGANLNHDDNDGNTPLWEAARRGNTECVKILLEAGADPDGFEERPDDPDWMHTETPLAVAASAEIAQMLLDAGADMSISMYADSVTGGRLRRHFRDEHISPLAHACLDGREEVAKFLLDRGADANAFDGQALRCLAISKAPPVPLLKALIRAGADVNGPEGNEPLRLAAFTGNGELCAALLKAGAKPVPEALPLAVQSGNLPCAEALLKGRVGNTSEAIRMAARENQREILDRLLEIYPGKGLGAALHGAIEGCHFELAMETMGMGVDPDVRDPGGMSPMVKLFSLDRRIDTWRRIINSPEKYALDHGYGRTCWRPHVWELDDPGCRRFGWNRPNNWNALLELCEQEALELAEQLINMGASTGLKDNMGRSVLWHACHRSWLKTIPWLLDMGLDLEERDRNGISCFDAGCLSHESYTIGPMLSRGFDVNTRDRNGDTALHKCARDPEEVRGYSSVIFHLIKNGADPDQKNKNGISFRMIAKENEHLACTLKWAEKEFM